MNNSKIMINKTHFNEWIWDSDVNEEIDVYKDYINYENYCPFCWEEYYKFSYKFEWDKLLVKCFYFVNKKWQSDEKYYIKNWIIIENNLWTDIANSWDELKWEKEFIWYVKGLIEWHELRLYWKYTYSRNAINWIINQIKNCKF